jgi:hypothetical protein
MTKLFHTSPTPVAWRLREDVHVPAIFGGDGPPQIYWRKAKTTPEAALDYARRVFHFRQLRTNEAKRRLAAISDPFWLEIVAGMNLKPMTVHRPVNRERTGYQGWGNE